LRFHKKFIRICVSNLRLETKNIAELRITLCFHLRSEIPRFTAKLLIFESQAKRLSAPMTINPDYLFLFKIKMVTFLDVFFQTNLNNYKDFRQILNFMVQQKIKLNRLEMLFLLRSLDKLLKNYLPSKSKYTILKTRQFLL